MWEEVVARQAARHDARDLRSALGCFPTGVCLITTAAPDGRRVGLTANSFSSVSLDPPMVLWSLARTASSAPVFRDAEYFTINVLASGDHELSTHFARSGEDKFAKYPERFRVGLAGVPVLEGAAATTSSSSAWWSATPTTPGGRRSCSTAAVTPPTARFVFPFRHARGATLRKAANSARS